MLSKTFTMGILRDVVAIKIASNRSLWAPPGKTTISKRDLVTSVFFSSRAAIECGGVASGSATGWFCLRRKAKAMKGEAAGNRACNVYGTLSANEALFALPQPQVLIEVWTYGSSAGSGVRASLTGSKCFSVRPALPWRSVTALIRDFFLIFSFSFTTKLHTGQYMSYDKL